MEENDKMRKKQMAWLFIPALIFGILALTDTEGMASDLNVSQEGTVEPSYIEMEDGEYAIGVTLEGGSGRAAVTSPCILIVEDARAYARIEWSSPYYDYMIIGDVTYLPVNEDGNSVFEIPITVFNEPMEVIADTTAMSVPHEIEYTLTFDAASIAGRNAMPQAARRVVYMALIIIAACIVVSLISKKRRKRQ